jgi:uncharacterized protein (DUF58 family)
MHPTRRTWRALGLGVVLASVAMVAAQPVLLLGVAGVGAWLLVTQYRTTVEFETTSADLTVDVAPVQPTTLVDEPLHVAVTAELTRPRPTDLSVTVSLPVTADGDATAHRQLHLPAGETVATTTFTCSFPVAGRFSFPPVDVELTDSTGTFTESLARETDTTVTIDPRRPRNVHVGQGGNQVAAAYGNHRTQARGAGLLPDEIRPYVPGDSLANIDWKATARQNSPHVREYEAETDRTTVLVVDHRASMALGPEGEQMVDYAREVALGIARSAGAGSDPLGLYTVGDGGITTKQLPTTSAQGYRTIYDTLYELEPTSATETRPTTETLTRPTDARRIGQQLQTDDSAFAQSVVPFLTDTEAYVHRIEDDPLFDTLRRIQREVRGTVWTIVLTSDADRNRVRDAVQITNKGGDEVTVFLTPQLLYEPGGFADLEAAYDQYVEFESFRARLDRAPRTSVYELAPGDRLDALLATRRRTRT